MSDSRLPTLDAGDEPTRRQDHDGPTRAQITAATRRNADTTAPPRTATLGELPPDEPGALLLGRYRLQRRLGTGAFGTVYRARDERLDRDVAVKVLPRDRVVNARFEREARAAARLQHPAIVTLYEAAVDDGAYLVSELVKGRTLADLLAAGKLSDRDLLEIGVCICDALDHAHAQGIIHRDVKPSNVLVSSRPSAGGQRAKLTDFGVAHVVGGDSLTRTGDVIGTAAYMSPEQAEGREVGPESDLFALALVLYEGLVGDNPQRRHGPPTGRHGTFIPPLRRQRRDLPRALGTAIDRALSHRADERGTVAQLRAALRECVPQAGEVAGVVAPGWGGAMPEPEPELGPEWDEADAYDERPRSLQFDGGGPLAATASAAARVAESLPRGLNAAAAGLAAAWLSVHLLSSPPLAPATIGLIAAAAVLVLPRLGWVAVVVLLAAYAGGEGRTAGALALLMVTVPPAVLLSYYGEGAALSAGAGALGVIGLAGAWPAVVAVICRGWWERAVVAAFGFVWLGAAGALWHRNLYWLPAQLPPAHAWSTSSGIALNGLLLPTVRSGVLAGALVWAAAAAVWPLLLRRRWPAVDLVVLVITSAMVVTATQMLGAHALRGPALGALAGVALLGTPALLDLLGSLRTFAGSEPPVA